MRGEVAVPSQSSSCRVSIRARQTTPGARTCHQNETWEGGPAPGSAHRPTPSRMLTRSPLQQQVGTPRHVRGAVTAAKHAGCVLGAGPGAKHACGKQSKLWGRGPESGSGAGPERDRGRNRGRGRGRGRGLGKRQLAARAGAGCSYPTERLERPAKTWLWVGHLL